MNRPNIIYLHSHDTGRYIQPYGYNVPTPNLQQLAEDGVLFRQCFNGGPTCSPSRACLVTGQWAHSNGMLGLAHRGFSLNDYRQHVIHTLKGAGYTSALSGIQHVASPDRSVIGYDHILPVDDKKSGAEQAASAFIRNAPPQPFFLSVGFFETHREFPDDTPHYNPNTMQPPRPLPDTPETRLDMARFCESARTLDEKMGAVIRAVDESGLRENTLIVCTTDHGIAFPRMKCNLHDSGIGVMLIMRGPRGFSGGRVVDSMISHIDIYPTLCELAGVEVPEFVQGKSMMPVIDGSAQSINDEIFSEVNYHAAYEPMRCVRTDRYKYIRRYDGRTAPVLPNCDQGPSKSVWVEAGWRDMAPPEEMLYDLVFDPNESNNLVDRPGHESVLKDMRARLDRWMQQTDDPLLAGPVPAPRGAKVNDPDGASPRDEPRIVE